MPIPISIEKELPYQLALWRTAGIGPVNYHRLIEHFGSAHSVLTAGHRELQQVKCPTSIIQSLRSPDWHSVEQDLTWLQSPHHHVVSPSNNYPTLLAEIYDPPPLLFVIGNPEVLCYPQIAIVGSRNPSPTGIETAHHFANALSQAGLCITSGLALGIDAASHRGALQANKPTIAILGNGLRTIYPARHQALAERISHTGALACEFPLDSKPQKNHFPRRNRIISGLSAGTLVVEATLKSGSLITARMALEQGRDVFAIPGSIRNPLARGCHTLIAQGAKLVETVNDVLEELAPGHRLPAQPRFPTKNNSDQKLDGDHLKLVECIGFETTSIDQAVQRSGLTAQKVISMLLILELHGYIESSPGGYLRST